MHSLQNGASISTNRQSIAYALYRYDMIKGKAEYIL